MGYKSQIISMIKYLSIDLHELVVPIKLEEFEFDSIEWVKPNNVVLHKFVGDIDYEFNYDDLDQITKKEILIFLLKMI